MLRKDNANAIVWICCVVFYGLHYRFKSIALTIDSALNRSRT